MKVLADFAGKKITKFIENDDGYTFQIGSDTLIFEMQMETSCCEVVSFSIEEIDKNISISTIIELDDHDKIFELNTNKGPIKIKFTNTNGIYSHQILVRLNDIIILRTSV